MRPLSLLQILSDCSVLSLSQASVSPGSYALSKCFLPEESTVISVYSLSGACLLLLFLAHCLWMKGLLQCLSLCLLGKHKSLWTTLPRAHHVPEPWSEVWCEDLQMWRSCSELAKPLFVQPWFVCPNVLPHCEGREYVFSISHLMMMVMMML